MSSKPRSNAPDPKAKGKGPAKDNKEKKAVQGPVVTPQALGILFGLVLVIGIPVFISNFIKKEQDAIAGIKSQIASKESEISTYRKKGGKKDEADRLNKALKEKLSTLDYLFLEDQASLVPFYDTTFFPLLNGSNLEAGAEAKLTVTEYTFRINMAMKPFDTLPSSGFFEDAASIFKTAYEPEQGGVPIEVPLDTRPTAFLQPYDIKLEGFRGTYTDVKRYVASLQSKSNDKLITVHCIKSASKDKRSGTFRTEHEWTIHMTVYFINPEQPANGDAPPSPPGSKTC